MKPSHAQTTRLACLNRHIVGEEDPIGIIETIPGRCNTPDHRSPPAANYFRDQRRRYGKEG
ncbi:MAG: hypothetical protein J1F20_08910 [Muribaculaceae bacterium]|nr:hypothetical protein [Muribaculaceae bacterium]